MSDFIKFNHWFALKLNKFPKIKQNKRKRKDNFQHQTEDRLNIIINNNKNVIYLNTKIITILNSNTTCHLPLERSNEVIFPYNWISDEPDFDLVSQKRIRLSKCPLMIMKPLPSATTTSLQLDPWNFVSIPVKKNIFFSN